MLWVALAVVVGWAATCAAFARLVPRLLRQHARERELLIAQLLHASGNPWTPAPAVEREQARKQAEEQAPQERRYAARPELLIED